MHPQLRAVIDEFERARARLHMLATTVPAGRWAERPHPARWSVSECIAHLNLTSAAYVPLLRDGIARARRAKGSAPRRYRRDLVGWLLWKSTGPPVRFRMTTTAPFVPAGADPPERLIAEADRLQDEQIARVREADGLPIGLVRIASPFDPRLKYNLYACLTILPRHQHRHLWQAEQAWQTVRAGPERGSQPAP